MRHSIQYIQTIGLLGTIPIPRHLQASAFIDPICQFFPNQCLLFGIQKTAPFYIQNNSYLCIDLVDVLASRPGRTGKDKSDAFFWNLDITHTNSIVKTASIA